MNEDEEKSVTTYHTQILAVTLGIGYRHQRTVMLGNLISGTSIIVRLNI